MIGPALDWAVAKCESRSDLLQRLTQQNKPVFFFGRDDVYYERVDYEPSVNWAQGGPIVEKLISRGCSLILTRLGEPACHNWATGQAHKGPTILIAAMRCYVASELGSEVKIPEELV